MCRGPELAAGAHGEVQQHERLRSWAARQASSKLTNGSNLFLTPGAAAVYCTSTSVNLASALLTCSCRRVSRRQGMHRQRCARHLFGFRFWEDRRHHSQSTLQRKRETCISAFVAVLAAPSRAHLAGVQEPAQHVTAVKHRSSTALLHRQAHQPINRPAHHLPPPPSINPKP